MTSRHLFDRLHLAFEPELDSSRPHLLGQVGSNLLVESAQEQRSAVDQGHVATQTGEDTRELDADVAAADDREPFRQPLQVERLVGADRMFDTGNGRHLGPAADRDQDLVRRHAAATVPAGFDLHRMRIEEARPSLEQLDAGAVEQAPVNPVQPLDFPVLVRDELPPVESGLRGRPAESAGFPVVVGEPRSADQELLRHAADVDASAAEVALLGHRHPGAVAGRHPAGPHAAGTGADHEEVVVVVRHGRNARPIGRETAKRP